MEKLCEDRVEPGDEGTVVEGVKVSKKVLSPLMCLTVTDMVSMKKQFCYYWHIRPSTHCSVVRLYGNQI